MNLSELYLNIKTVTFASLVCQTDVQTPDDVTNYQQQGHQMMFTETDFRSQFPGVDPSRIFYSPSLSLSCLYFNKESLAVCPFHIEMFSMGIGGFTVEKFLAVARKSETEVAGGEYLRSILLLPDAMQLEYFDMLIAKKNVPDLYQLFFSVYTESDYGFKLLNKDTLRTIFDSKTDEDKKLTAEKMEFLPDTIKVFRGENTESTPHSESYSWTTDINVANFFATRRGNGPGYIIEGEVDKADIIEVLLDDRSESELIVPPEKVRILEVHSLHGMDFLKEIIPIVAPVYRKYRDEMDELDFAQESSIHGRDHQARVLLLTQMISQLLDLPMSDRKILAAAAIFHDTQRTNDWVDASHGKASADYYARQFKHPDPIVMFLCEYHCPPDDEAYRHIKNNRVLSKSRSKAKLLYDVFCDSDSLDRIRLPGGIKELDMNQLRLEISRQLPLVARICLEQVKV